MPYAVTQVSQELTACMIHQTSKTSRLQTYLWPCLPYLRALARYPARSNSLHFKPRADENRTKANLCFSVIPRLGDPLELRIHFF